MYSKGLARLIVAVTMGFDGYASSEECLIIRLKKAGAAPNYALSVAKQLTNSIFGEIGVAVHWGVDHDKPLRISCVSVEVHFDKAATSGRGVDAMGYAFPYSEALEVHIFIGRVLQCRLTCSDVFTQMREGALLGHVIAHELGHVLQGLARHSEDGVMKAIWTPKDVAGMVKRRFSFTENDARLIHRRLLRSRTIAPIKSDQDGQAKFATGPRREARTHRRYQEIMVILDSSSEADGGHRP